MSNQLNEEMINWSKGWRIVLSRMFEAVVHTGDCENRHLIAPCQGTCAACEYETKSERSRSTGVEEGK